jgi:hypothetical protein
MHSFCCSLLLAPPLTHHSAHSPSAAGAPDALASATSSLPLLQQPSCEGRSTLLVDLGRVVRLHEAWCSALPHVRPCYAGEASWATECAMTVQVLYVACDHVSQASYALWLGGNGLPLPCMCSTAADISRH